ncbi:MAG: hypothetical protein QMD32_06510 [Smithellaceae bacterium]|nr:hypothetical protein [Smithellaceae bacterium]
MIQTVEAIINERGQVLLLDRIKLPAARRALVTILDDEPACNVNEAALLSEKTLATDWNRPEEDAAWSHLQQPR